MYLYNMENIKTIVKEIINNHLTEDVTNQLKLAFDNKIEGRILDHKESLELKKEIESNHLKDGDLPFGLTNDLRMNVFNYDNPIASKTVNGVDLRITTGLIRDGRKTYLLYANGDIVGEFYKVDDIKKIVKFIENNLLNSKNKEIGKN